MMPKFELDTRVRFQSRTSTDTHDYEFGEVVAARRDGETVSYEIVCEEGGRALIAEAELHEVPLEAL